MIYIYDVTLNFNETFYDFFEWNNSDYLYHIKRIPIIELNRKDFINIFNNIIKFNNDTYKMINDKTEIYGKKDKKFSCVLLKHDNNLFALKIDNNRIASQISSILVEEELDILEVKTNINSSIEYEIVGKREFMSSTRKERKNISFLNKQINNLNLINDKEKIKYLYFEYFGSINKNTKDALNKLKEEIKNSNSLDNLKNFFIFESNKN